MTDLGKRWNLLISIGTRLHFSVRGVEGGGGGAAGVHATHFFQKRIYMFYNVLSPIIS